MEQLRQMDEIIELIEDKGFSPNEIVIYYELGCRLEYMTLTPEQQLEVHSRIYEEYISNESYEIYEHVNVAMDNLEELLNNEDFDFIHYL